MNKKICVIFVVLMAIAMLATPVLAAPTKEQKVPVEMINKPVITGSITCQRTGIQYPHAASAWWAANGFKDEGVVAQRRDAGYVRNFDLVIKYETGAITLQGISFNELDRMWKYATFNPDVPFPPVSGYPAQVLTGSDSITQFDAVWEFQPQTGLSTYGGFEGNINHVMKDYGLPTTYEKLNCVLQGFGAFEGQTLQMSFDSREGTTNWTGYLLKP